MNCPPDHKHELTSHCYVSHKCRCESCRAAYNASRRAYWARTHASDPVAVDLAVDGHRVFLTTEQRAEAVHRLWRKRWSDRAIAAQLHISDRTVLRIRQRNNWQAWPYWEQVQQCR